MPVYPGDYKKMKPDTEYAAVYDGDSGYSVVYYSLDGERQITGPDARQAAKRLARSWQHVATEGSAEGLVTLYKRAK
jgi:hypothetical protein